jgi:phytoene synthase
MRSLTAHHSKSFFVSAMMLPAETRWATFALYGFCRHADNIIDLPRDRSKTELLTEIGALRNELITAYRTGESEHPIIQPFIFVCQKYDIPIQYPLELLHGVEMDLHYHHYQNFNDLYTFCYRVAGVVGIMMTYVLGYHSPQAFYYAEKLGIAMQLTNILRDVQEDKNMGRIYLPLDELAAFGLQESDIINEVWDNRTKSLLCFQIERARRFYDEALPGIGMLKKSSRFAITASARIYGNILNKIVENDSNPFQGRVYLSQNEKFRVLLSEWFNNKRAGYEFKPTQNFTNVNQSYVKEKVS